MNILFFKKQLLKPLDFIKPLINPRSPLPILTSVKLEVIEDGNLKVTGGKQQTLIDFIVTDINVGGQVGDAVCVDHKQLYDCLKSMPEVGISIVVKNDNTLEVDYNTGKMSLATSTAKDFPALEVINSELLSVSQEMLEYITKAFAFAGNDELRPILGNIYIDTVNGYIASTDTAIMYRSPMWKEGELNVNPIIVNKEVGVLLRGLKGTVDMGVGERTIMVKNDQFTITSSLVEGRYPNYMAVIPKDNPIEVIVDRLTLLNALNRAKVSAYEKAPIMAMHLKDSNIDITAEDIQTSRSNKESVPANIDSGVDLVIGLNIGLLISAVNSLKCETISISAKTDRSPIIITEVDNTSEFFLLSPSTLNN